MRFHQNIKFPMRGQHRCNVDPLEIHHFWTFRGHDLWVEFARHSKESLVLECSPLARDLHAHLLLQHRMCSFGAMFVGAPAPFATVTFPMCQIQVRRSHSLTRICYNNKCGFNSLNFNGLRLHFVLFGIVAYWSVGRMARVLQIGKGFQLFAITSVAAKSFCVCLYFRFSNFRWQICRHRQNRIPIAEVSGNVGIAFPRSVAFTFVCQCNRAWNAILVFAHPSQLEFAISKTLPRVPGTPRRRRRRANARICRTHVHCLRAPCAQTHFIFDGVGSWAGGGIILHGGLLLPRGSAKYRHDLGRRIVPVQGPLGFPWGRAFCWYSTRVIAKCSAALSSNRLCVCLPPALRMCFDPPRVPARSDDGGKHSVGACPGGMRG